MPIYMKEASELVSMDVKMRIVSLNSVLYGSTGKIMLNISETVTNGGGDAIVCVPNGRHNKAKTLNKYIDECAKSVL